MSNLLRIKFPTSNPLNRARSFSVPLVSKIRSRDIAFGRAQFKVNARKARQSHFGAFRCPFNSTYRSIKRGMPQIPTHNHFQKPGRRLHRERIWWKSGSKSFNLFLNTVLVAGSINPRSDLPSQNDLHPSTVPNNVPTTSTIQSHLNPFR